MNIAEHRSEADRLSVLQKNSRSRFLLLPERTMYRDGRTPFTSVFTIKLLGKLDETRLHQALARVQDKHPLLRCVIDNIDGRARFILQDRPTPISLRIVERSGEEDWQNEVRREWVMPFDASCEPLVRLVWLCGGDVNELILVGHHCICDGTAGINLLRECLSVYDQPEQELDGYGSLGTVEDIVPAVLLQSRRFRRRVRWKVGLLRLALLLKRHGSRKSAGPRISAEQMYFHRWKVSDTMTQSLIDRCRAEDVTVLAAASVAFMQAFRDVRGPQALSKAATMVNVRRFLPRMRADAMFGLAPSVALRMKDLPPPQDISANGFWARGRMIKTDLTRRIDRLGSSLYEYLVGLEDLHDKYAKLVAHFEDVPIVRHLTLSNMGRLDLPQQYRDFQLETIYSPLVMVSPTPANTVVLSSFGGQLEIAIVSDESSLPRAEAAAIEQRAMEILRICIGLPALHRSAGADSPSLVRAKAT